MTNIYEFKNDSIKYKFKPKMQTEKARIIHQIDLLCNCIQNIHAPEETVPYHSLFYTASNFACTCRKNNQKEGYPLQAMPL